MKFGSFEIIIRFGRRRRRRRRVAFVALTLDPIPKRRRSQMFHLRTDQMYKIGIKPVDKDNNPAPIDGVPVITTGDAAIIEVREHPEHGPVLYPLDDMGGELSLTTSLTIKFDADLGEGVAEKVVEDTLIVTGPGAESAIIELEGIPKE